MSLSRKGHGGSESSSFLGAGQLLPWIPLEVLLGRGPSYLPSPPPQAGQEVLLDASLVGFGNFTVQIEGEGDIADQGIYSKCGLALRPREGKSGNEASGAKTTGTCFIVPGQGSMAGRLTKPRLTSGGSCHPQVQGRMKLPLDGGWALP